MSSQNIPFKLFASDLSLNDPGNGGTITVERSPCVVELDATGSETRVLDAADRVGVLLVLIMRTGTNIDVTTPSGTIPLTTTGQPVMLVSSRSGNSYVWRQIASTGGVVDIAGLEAEIDQLQQDVITLEGAVQTIQYSDLATAASIDAINTAISQLSTAVSGNSSTNVTQASQIATLQGNVTTLQSDVSDIETLDAAQQAEIDQLQLDVTALENSVASISTNAGIYIVRDGEVVLDATAAATTPAEVGAAFKTALAALQSGDTLLCGAVYGEMSDAVCSTASVTILCNGTVFKHLDSYANLLSLQAANITVKGITLDGGEYASQTGTNRGRGISISGDNCTVMQCTVKGMRGYTTGFGEGFFAFDCKRPRIIDCKAERCYYAGFILNDTPDALVHNFQSINNMNRVASTSSSAPVNRITLSNVYGYLDYDTGQAAAPAINVNHTGRVSDYVITNLHLHMTDVVSPGVSWDDTDNRNMLKFQGVDRLRLSNCTVQHGKNAGTGVTYSWRLESPSFEQVRELYIHNCSFWGPVNQIGTTPERIICTDSSFGVGHRDAADVWDDLGADFIYITRCHFNLHDAARVFTTVSDIGSTWQWRIFDNDFTGNSSSNLYIMQGTTGLNAMAGRLVCARNRMSNTGSGQFYITNTRTASLICSTDMEGNPIFDELLESATGSFNVQPLPGAGPLYFDGLVPAGPEGTRIINLRHATTGGNYPRYFVSNGTNWIAAPVTSSGGERKEGQDPLGIVSTVLAVNFDQGSYDNKTFVLFNDNCELVLSATRPGVYHLVVSQLGIPAKTLTYPPNVLWEGSVKQPNATLNSVTVIRLYFDGANFHAS